MIVVSKKIAAALIIVLGCALPCAFAKILPVGPGERFAEITPAVAAAHAFDTLLVKKATYREHTIIINKPLWVMGEGMPVIDARNKEADIFIIMSDSVFIEGFVLSNVGVSYLNEYAAVKVRKGRNGVVRNNTIKDCYFGIYLEYARDYIISNNDIVAHTKDESSAGNAIHVWKANNIEIAYNSATGHRDGIYFEFVDDSKIHHNVSFNNLRYGLHFMFSNRDGYFFNEFTDNGAGVAVMFSKQIRMEENLFANNWGTASYGLLLKEISDGEIHKNRFIQNTIGILAEGANRLSIQRNQFTQNGTALDMKGNCLDNKVTHNNFLANTFEVVTNSKYNNNEYNSNYWSLYSGYDLDRDGFGDLPYRPVNLFAKITNEIPSASIMLHSFFVNILELSERIFPEIIPEELVDKKPRMRPYIL